jgi:hypothetical protein
MKCLAQHDLYDNKNQNKEIQNLPTLVAVVESFSLLPTLPSLIFLRSAYDKRLHHLENFNLEA